MSLKKAGLTIPEAVISLALIVLAAMAVFNSLENAGMLSQKSEFKAMSVDYARQLMEDTYYDFGVATTSGAVSVPINGTDPFLINHNVTRTLNVASDSTNEYNIVEVKVSWQ